MRAGSVANLGQVASAGNGMLLGKPIKHTILNDIKLTTASQITKKSGPATITTDTTAPVPAGQASQIRVTGAGYSTTSALEMTFPTPWNMTNSYFRYQVRCSNYGYIRSAYYSFKLATNKAAADAGNYLSFRPSPSATPNWLVPNLYCWDAFHPANMTVNGTAPDLSSIGYVLIGLGDSSSSTGPVWDFGAFQNIQCVSAKAKCVIWHDDSILSGATPIRTKLSAYGWAAMEANEWETIDSGTVFLSSSDMATMKAAGWVFGSHATTNAEHTNVLSASVANQALRNKVRAAKLGYGADAIDFAYWGGLSSVQGYPIAQRMYRSGRWYTSGLTTVEMLPPADPALTKAYGAGTGETFSGNWKQLIDSAIAAKGLAQIVFHQQIGSDSTQATEFDSMLTYLDSQRANIDVVTLPVAFQDSVA